MKIRMIATALVLSGLSVPVIAQDTAPPAPAAQPPAPQPPVSQPPAADPNAIGPTGAVPPSAQGMQPADPTVPQNPTAPVGSAQNPVVVGGNMTAPPPPPKDYPKCTKTITDACVQGGGQSSGHKKHKK